MYIKIKMLDIKFVRSNPDVVKQNIKNKFQDEKIPMVDEVIDLDAKRRAAQQEADELKAKKNQISKQIGALMAQGKRDEAEEVKKQVAENAEKLNQNEEFGKWNYSYMKVEIVETALNSNRKTYLNSVYLF